MDKILLIIQREYLTRVRKKAFIIMTLLVPTLFGGMFATVAYLAKNNDEKVHTIKVVDQTSRFKNKFRDNKVLKFQYPEKPIDSVKASLSDDDLALLIPSNKKDSVTLFSKKKNNLGLSDDIQQKMNDIV